LPDFIRSPSLIRLESQLLVAKAYDVAVAQKLRSLYPVTIDEHAVPAAVSQAIPALKRRHLGVTPRNAF